MHKRPFFIFIGLVLSLILLSIGFVQSARFARMIKSLAANHIPKNTGIEGDFSGFEIRFFPPAICIRNPQVILRGNNVVNLPPDSKINADRIEFRFYPLQMLTGNIRVHEAVIVNGDVNLILDPEALAKDSMPKKSKGINFHWDELFQFNAEAISFRNTNIVIVEKTNRWKLTFHAEEMAVGQWAGKGGMGYQLAIDLDHFKANYPESWPLPDALERLKLQAKVNAQGVSFDKFSFVQQGVSFSSVGKIRGNLLNPDHESLLLNSDFELQGDLIPLRTGFSKTFSGFLEEQLGSTAKGQIKLQGSLQADILNFRKTLKIDGSLSGQNLDVQGWKADSLEMQAQWKSLNSERMADIRVAKFSVFSKEVPRLGGFQPASGGRISVSPFQYTFGDSSPLKIHADLEKVHVHWLLGQEVAGLYPLDFRVDGPIDAEVVIPQGKDSFRASAKIDFKIPHFQFDNQRLGKNKNLARILSFPQVHLKADIKADSKEIKISHSQLKFGSEYGNDLDVDGAYQFKKGLDLVAHGKVNLSEIGMIAENEIRGHGPLEAHVYTVGKNIAVDFDADLTDAFYIKLNIGNLKGRISVNTNPDQILFRNIKVVKGQTFYSGEGRLWLEGKEKIDLDFKISQGDVQDLIQVFQIQTHDLWWFPASLTGKVWGDVTVSGGIKTEELSVVGNLAAESVDFKNERFRSASMSVGMDKGKYFVRNAKILKNRGKLLGYIEYKKGEGFDWNLETQSFTVNDFDYFTRLGVPYHGNLDVHSKGSGKEEDVSSRTSANLSNFMIRGINYPGSQLKMITERGVLDLDASLIGGQGLVQFNYDDHKGQSNSIKAQFQKMDFTPILLLLNSNLMHDPSLLAVISANMDLRFRTGEFKHSSGKMNFNEFLMSKTGTLINLIDPVAVDMHDGSFDPVQFKLRAEEGDALLALSSRHAALSGEMSGVLGLGFLEFLTPAIVKAGGKANLDFKVGGFLDNPNVFGRALIEGGRVQLAALETPFENVRGGLRLKDGVLEVQDLRSTLATGRVTTKGTVHIFTDRAPELDIYGTLSKNRLKIFPFQYVQTTGPVHIYGKELPYQIDGDIDVESALSQEKVLKKKGTEGLKVARYTPTTNYGRDKTDYPLFKLNIHDKADEGVWIKNDLFDIELKADLKILNTIQVPRFEGEAELIQGKLLFQETSFQIQSARLTFDNPTVLDPKFNLNAQADVSSTKVFLYASGRISKWDLELTSDPVLPESEILSLLTLGLTTQELQQLKANDQSVLQQGEAASLLLHSLDFNRNVQERTGFKVQLDEAVDTQIGKSAFRPSTDYDNAAAPKIVIRRDVGKRLGFSVGSTVGAGTTSEKEVNAEVKVTKGMSILGVWNTFEGVNSEDSTTSYGLDLKFQKKFK